MAKYRKKPVVIEAIQITGGLDNEKEIYSFINDFDSYDLIGTPFHAIKIKTLEGEMIGGFNDFIIKGVNGEFYPCKPDIFEKTYEKVNDA